MTVKRVQKKPVGRRPAGARANGKHLTYHDSIRKHLSTVQGVEAVYTWVDRRIVHVTSVVKDHESEIYDTLIPAETMVEKEHPRTYFEFHVRARQKRQVDDAIPASVNLVFKK